VPLKVKSYRKTYRAVIEPAEHMPFDDYDSTLLRMEITFTVSQLSKLTPEIIINRTLRDLHIVNFMEVTSLEEVKDGK
jgi:hypothetical protein